MATKVWTHGGTPGTTLSLIFSGTTAPPNWLAAIDAWVATANENGDSGTVLLASPGANTGMFVFLDNDGGIPPTATIDTLRLTFDWAVTNGPMGGGLAESFFGGSWPVGQGPIGPGAQTGAYDETASATDVLGATDPVTLFATALGFLYAQTQTGVFAAHNRRLSVSNLAIEVVYTGGATVTAINPSAGSVNGGQAVTITGEGFLAATGVELGGVAATSVVIVSDTSITAVTPAHASGVVDVEVLSVATGTDLYTYFIPPSFRLDPIPTKTPMTQGGGRKRG